jgi:hypothetical protein
MSIFTRFTNRMWPNRLNRDLRDEVEFHIDMRANEHLKAGRSKGEAIKEARQQFGDVDSVIADMREARLSSTTMLVAMTALLAVSVAFWIAQGEIRSPDLMTPALPAAPVMRDLDRRSGSPPPPPRPPTCEEYLAKVKTHQINPRSRFDRCGAFNDTKSR